MVLERKIYWYCQFIFTISLLSPHEKGRRPSFEQTYIPYTKGCFVQSLAHWFSIRIFLIIQCIFVILLLSPLWKKRGLSSNFNPLHTMRLCAKFGWNWPNGSEEKDLLILSMYFCYFVVTCITTWNKIEIGAILFLENKICQFR